MLLPPSHPPSARFDFPVSSMINGFPIQSDPVDNTLAFDASMSTSATTTEGELSSSLGGALLPSHWAPDPVCCPRPKHGKIGAHRRPTGWSWTFCAATFVLGLCNVRTRGATANYTLSSASPPRCVSPYMLRGGRRVGVAVLVDQEGERRELYVSTITSTNSGIEISKRRPFSYYGCYGAINSMECFTLLSLSLYRLIHYTFHCSYTG